VQIWFPGLSLPGTIKAGALLDVWLLGLNLKIPPVDIVLWKEPLIIWTAFIIFDSDWVVKPIIDAIAGVAKAVWDLAKGTLDSWAEAFYKAHSTYEEYVREKDEQRKKAEQQAK